MPRKPRFATEEERRAHQKKYLADWYVKNRTYARAKQREYNRTNREWLRARRLEREFGLTPQHHAAMLQEQSGLCALCGEPGKLVVDHDHATGKIRGLIHGNCNVALGLLKDSPVRALAAHRYLVEHLRVNDVHQR